MDDPVRLISYNFGFFFLLWESHCLLAVVDESACLEADLCCVDPEMSVTGVEAAKFVCLSLVAADNS